MDVRGLLQGEDRDNALQTHFYSLEYHILLK